MRPTKAIYVDWFMPRKKRGAISKFKKPWEIAMIIRSTHFCKEYNNLSPILYCDSEIYEYYKEVGLDRCFDEIRPILPTIPDFDPSIFWSAGKFIAINDVDENFLMIDLDAEVRFEIDFSNCDVFCAHAEGILENDLVHYPDPGLIDTNGYFTSKYGFNWDKKAYNTSLLYFKDLQIAKEYATEALNFIRGTDKINPSFEIAYILLPEQRFLYEFCKYNQLKVSRLISGIYQPEDKLRKTKCFFDNSNIDEITDRGFLHVWGFKKKIFNIEDEEQALFGKLISSRLNLKDHIIECVIKNKELYGSKNIHLDD
jgi:hypothetical protein